ncbi:MAG: S9 family peptidase [Acidobacteriota bacterium]
MKTMRWLGLLPSAFLLACGPAGSGDSDESAPPPVYDATTFFQTETVTGASFNAEETRILFSSDRTGTFNVYSAAVDGSAVEALTDSQTDSTFAVSYFPKDERFLFSRDGGGNELSHVFVRELDGTERDLTPGDNVRASFGGWTGDRSGFWVLSNERNPQAIDLYRYATDGYERELVFENPGGLFVGGVSDDERYVSLTQRRSNADSDVYVYDRQTGERTHVTPHEGDVTHQSAGFTPDSRTLLYRTDDGSEFAQVWGYDLATGEKTSLKEADWDVGAYSYSETGKYLVTSINADASTVIEIALAESGEPVELPELGEGDLAGLSFSASDRLLAYYLNSDTSPSNLHVLDFETGSTVKLTDSLSEEIAADALVASTVIRYPSFDGLEIPALLYRPQGATADTPAPAIINVHGGPGGQSRKGYNANVQHLVNQGYAVLSVNNRGSSGYGKTFFHLDDKRHGEVDLQDCVYGRKYLESLDWVDGERVAILGGSYGGYMVAAALAFEPEVFDVGVDIFGVTNWVRTLQSIPPWWGANRDSLFAELGDPATDLERLERISPLFHAQNIVKPLIVIQGANDPRVLQAESDDLVAAVKENGVPVEYVVFPDEGHGFRKRENRITSAQSIADFLAQHLARDGRAPAAPAPAAPEGDAGEAGP